MICRSCEGACDVIYNSSIYSTGSIRIEKCPDCKGVGTVPDDAAAKVIRLLAMRLEWDQKGSDVWFDREEMALVKEALKEIDGG